LKDEETATAMWTKTGLELKSFVCSMNPEKEDPAALKADAESKGLAFLC